jgi:hypothetical protein
MAVAPSLQRFVDDELTRSADLAARTHAGALQLLRDPKDSALAPAERGHQRDVAQALQGHMAAFCEAFVCALRDRVAEEVRSFQGAPAPMPAAAAAGGLELMDEGRVEIDIEISRAIQIIDTTAEWQLRELQTFTSTLAGLDQVSADSNPLRPAVYAAALWQAACAVSDKPVVRFIVLRVASGVLAGLLKNAWAAATSRLEAQGVEPSVYRTVLLAPNAVPSREAKGGTRISVLGDLLEGLVQGGTAGMARGPGGNGMQRGGAGAGTGAGSAARPARSAGQGTDATLEQQIGELMARLFDHIQSDVQIAPAVRTVIARARAPATWVAQHDPLTLDGYDHVVWRLIDRIGDTAAAYVSPGDPRLLAWLARCEVLLAQLEAQADPQGMHFRRALVQLEAFAEEQGDMQRQAAAAAVRSLQHAERAEMLEQHLAQRLTEQMTSVRASPSMRRFVTGAWARAIAMAIVRLGEQHPTTVGYVKAVDELLWSLNIPDHPQSRQRLVALLPSLLQRLRSGMESIALPAGEQDHVLEELMALHTEALRPGGRAAATLTPQQIVQQLRDEVVEPVAPQAAFADSVIDLGSMQTVPAEFMHTDLPGAPAASRGIDGIAVGQGRRVFLQGRWARLQLLWRSEQGGYLLFAAETPGRTHSITRRALERLHDAGLVEPLQAQPVVQRNVDALVRELSLLR